MHKVLQVFFDNPTPQGGYYLRELSRKASLAPTSVKNHLQTLINQGLVVAKQHRVHDYDTYYASENQAFRFHKSQYTLYQLQEAVNYIQESTLADCIILFGSASRGEDTPQSDIDLYVQAPQTDLQLTTYENVLNRKINVLFQESFENFSRELKNNLVNGILVR